MQKYLELYAPNGTTKLGMVRVQGEISYTKGINKYNSITFSVLTSDLAQFPSFGIGCRVKLVISNVPPQIFVVVNRDFDTQNQNIENLYCNDVLYLLTLDTVGSVEYRNVPFQNIITNLLSRANTPTTTWAVQFSDVTANDVLTMTFEDESFFEALMVIVKYIRGYMCLSPTAPYTIKIGQFRDVGLIYSRYDDDAATFDVQAHYDFVPSQLQNVGQNYIQYIDTMWKDAPNFVPISSLQIVEDGEVLCTKIIPMGGQVYPKKDYYGTQVGMSYLDLSWSNVAKHIYDRNSGDPTYNNLTNPIMENKRVWDVQRKHWFVVNPSAVAQYGLQVKKMKLNEIVPVTTNQDGEIHEENLRLAANTVYQVAKYALELDSKPRYTYTVISEYTPQSLVVLNPSDVVIVNYDGFVITPSGVQQHRRIDKQPMLVKEVSVQYKDNTAKLTLKLATSGEEVTNIYEVMTDVLNTSRFGIQVQTSLSDYYRASPMILFNGYLPNQQTFPRQARHTFYLSDNIVAVNSMYLEAILTRVYLPIAVGGNVRPATIGTPIGGNAGQLTAHVPQNRDAQGNVAIQNVKLTDQYGNQLNPNAPNVDLRHSHVIEPLVNYFYTPPYSYVWDGSNFIPDPERGNKLADWFKYVLDSYFSTGLGVGMVFSVLDWWKNPWETKLAIAAFNSSWNTNHRIHAAASLQDNMLKNHQHRWGESDQWGNIIVPDHTHEIQRGTYQDSWGDMTSLVVNGQDILSQTPVRSYGDGYISRSTVWDITNIAHNAMYGKTIYITADMQYDRLMYVQFALYGVVTLAPFAWRG